MNNRERLIDIMYEQGLDRRDLAELVHVDRRTVDDWLAPGESTHRIEVPEMAIELLNLKLAANRKSTTSNGGENSTDS